MFWAFSFVFLMILPSNLLLTPIMTMILRPIVILLPNFSVFLVVEGINANTLFTFSTNAATILVEEVLSASMKKFVGNMVVVLMHIGLYSLTRWDLNIKCILQYDEDTMTFISELKAVKFLSEVLPG